MGGRPEDAEAPTLAQTAPERSSRPAISQLTTGATIGRYRLETRLGAGAMGVVWSAHDPQLDRKIAIKLVHPALARSDEAAGRLLREARAMAKLSHRAVVTVHDAGDEAGQLFIAMELVDGTNLGTLLRSRPPGVVADWARWLAMLLDAGRGLAHAHAHGVLHRDFKPDNVLVDDRGRVCVGDFGLATLGEDALAAAASRRETKDELDLTTTGALLGTPAYMSPQGLRGEEIDARADQFSFCVAAWEAVYGARPFLVEGTGLDAIPELTDKIEAGALPPAPDGSTVPDAVRAVLARGLAAAPDARWPDMESLLAELSRASRARAATAAPVAAPPRRTGLVLGLVGAGTTAAVAIAFALGRRGAEPTPPLSSLTRASSGVIAKRLFSVPLRTGLSLSGDGRYLATNSDRLTVREVDGRGLWSALLPTGTGEVYGLDFEGDELRFAVRREASLYRWRFASGDAAAAEPFDVAVAGHWYGRTAGGEVVWHPEDRVLQLWRAGREVTRWPARHSVDSCRISPDRQRIAYVESGRFSGRLVVRDVVQDRELAARELVAPTAIAWRDDATLLYATGALEQPRIWSVTVGDDGLGEPVELYGLDHGWFGQIQAHDDRLFVIQMQPSPRARLVDRSGASATARDLDQGTVALGWTSATEFLSWSRTSHRVERRDARSTVELLAAELDGEPANTTIAGDVLIVALRRDAGRETVAVSLADGRTLWRHPDGRTLAVRCAGDRAPPCFAIRALADADQLVTLDPATGELGTAPIHTGRIEDVAVDAAGARLLLVGDGRRIYEIAPTGTVLAQHDGISASVRSVAWDPTGGFLIGGTVLRNTFTVGRFHDGVFTALVTTGDDLLSMVRPSPDGAQVLVLARLYAPEVWQLQLPR